MAPVRLGAPGAILGLVATLGTAACGSPRASSAEVDAGGVSSTSAPGSSSGPSQTSATSGATAQTASGNTTATQSSGTTTPTASRTSTSSGSGSASRSTTSAGSSTGSSSASSSASGSSAGFDPCPRSGNCVVMPLGDSITFGSTSNNGGYRVELFARAIAGGKQLTFVGSQSDGPDTVAGAPFPKANEGHPGWTIAQIAGIATATGALAPTPHIVLLHIGTNDITQQLTGLPDRLGSLVDQIVAALPSSLLVVAQIIPISFAESTVVTYNTAIASLVQQRAAQGKHVLVVDMNTGFPTSNGYASDNLHPNDAVGYPWMGDKWYATIGSYLH
jgi:lysophospholipase L1-like esterase